MDRRVALTVAVVVLVSLSGCSALPIWDGGDSNGGAGTPTVPGAEPGGGGGSGPDVTYPSGYGPSGVTDPGKALSSHVGSLSATSGYIFTHQSIIQEGDGQAVIRISQSADNRDEVGFVVRETPQGAIAEYYENGTVYIRDGTGNETTYNSSSSNYTMNEFTGLQFVGPLLAHVEYKDAEVVDTEQGTFYRYSSEKVTNPGAILRSDVDESRIDRFEVGIVVDENGVVRQARFVVEADRDITVDMGVSEIGTTDVGRPDWFQQAANS